MMPRIHWVVVCMGRGVDGSSTISGTASLWCSFWVMMCVCQAIPDMFSASMLQTRGSVRVYRRQA
jgi:hypothetical protein